MTEFIITLQSRFGDQRKEVTIEAETRHLAVKAAESSELGWRAVRVTTIVTVAGRCKRCGAVLFADDRARGKRQQLVCYDCP